jgi:hypothetical protein
LSSEPTAMSEAVWQALTQKPRRFMGGRFATRVPGLRYDRLGYLRIWKSGIDSVISMTRLCNPKIIQCVNSARRPLSRIQSAVNG